MDKANLCESDFIEETLREMEKSSAFYLRTKNYILDTSVLIQDPKSIFAFEDNNVIITGTTLQELDKRMSHNRENLFVSQIAGSLKSLMECGNLRDGIQLSNGGYLIVEPDGVNERNLPDGFSVKSADNRIISTCVTLMQRNPDAKFTLVTNKSLMAVNASVCGVNVESYQNGRIKDTGYTGYEKVVVNDENIINELVQDRRVSEDDMRNAIVDEAQNTPQLLMKDILTRPEEGTKIVISGDPVQIDNELLDRDNNGLALAIERMKDSPLAALITFGAEECNRSPLAADALRRLDDIRKDGLNDGRN